MNRPNADPNTIIGLHDPNETENQNPNVITGITENQNPNVIAGIQENTDKSEGISSKGNFTYFNLITANQINKETSDKLNQNSDLIVKQVKEYFTNINEKLNNLDVEIKNMDVYSNTSQLTISIQENQEGSVITSHMTEESEQHSEKHNYVLKTSKTNSKK